MKLITLFIVAAFLVVVANGQFDLGDSKTFSMKVESNVLVVKGEYKGCADQDELSKLHPASILLPKQITAPESWKLDDLIAWTYPHFIDVLSSSLDTQLDYFAERVIVTPTNAVADAGNAHILSLMPAETISFISYDTIIGGTANEEHYPPEFLHTLDSSGMPPHLEIARFNSRIMTNPHAAQTAGSP